MTLRLSGFIFLLALGVSVNTPAIAIQSPPSSLTSNSAGQRFHDLYTSQWQWRRGQFAGADDENNRGQAANHLPKVDVATQAMREAYWVKVLATLETISKGQLNAPDQVNYEIYRQQTQALLDNQHFKTWQMPFNGDSGFWSDLGFTARATYSTQQEYQDYVGKLRDIPRYFNEQTENMRLGLARGFRQPQVILHGRTQSISDIANAPGKQNPFYAPFRSMPSSIPAAEQARLRAVALAAIKQEVIPANAGLLDFMQAEHIPKARTAIAAEDLPDGIAFYQAQIRKYTTLNLTPDAIHQLGLEQMAIIHQQMLETIKQTGFKGSFGDFLNFLRTDPRFYAKTPDELLQDAAWIAKNVDGVIGNYIGRLPRQRFAIKPVPADLAPTCTSGRGGPGMYMVNTYNLSARPLYSLP